MGRKPIDPETKERVRATVRRLREEQGLTQRVLSDRSGVSEVVISRIERGEVGWGYGTLQQLAHGLGVTPRYLTGETDPDAMKLRVGFQMKIDITPGENPTEELRREAIEAAQKVLEPFNERYRKQLRDSGGERAPPEDGPPDDETD